MANVVKCFLFLLMLMLSLMGCDRTWLEPLEREVYTPVIPEVPPDTATVKMNWCTRDADRRVDNLKFVFIIDKSGSNQENPGTDPFGERRYRTLLAFLENPNNSTSDTSYYALINFSLSARRVPTGSGFVNDKNQFINTVRLDAGFDGTSFHPTDVGPTDYLAALTEVKNLINEDINFMKTLPKVTASHYVIFFLSDGAPLVEGQLQDTGAILAKVSGLRDLALDTTSAPYIASLRFHTGYYFNTASDPVAEGLMRQMAHSGDGDFFNFGNGQAIDFEQFAVPEQMIRHYLRDVVVRNITTVWGPSGDLLKDNDGDGLANDLEVALGSDFRKRDSDDNGVSDLVENAVFGKPCHDRHCLASRANVFTTCERFRKASTGAQVEYNDTDNDGLNDCEETLLTSDFEDFDSNGDWIPDFRAFADGLSFIEGTLEADNDRDYDGANNYQEVKVHTPVDIPNSLIRKLRVYQYRLNNVSSDNNRDCFELTVNDILVLGDDNEIEVVELESTSVISNKKYIRKVKKALGSLRSLQISDEELK